MNKRELVSWHGVRGAVPFLLPGERPGVVVAGEVGVDRRILVVVLISLFLLLYWLTPLGPDGLTGEALEHQEHILLVRVIGTIVISAASFIATSTLVRRQYYVLTNERLITLRSRMFGVGPGGLVEAEPVAGVRIDAIRRSFPGYAFGLRRIDGRTTLARTGRSWKREIEALAASLDAGIVAPARPDAISA